MEKVSERNKRIFRLTDIKQDVEKGFAHQEGYGADMFCIVQPEENVPVRVLAKHQFFQLLNLPTAEMEPVLFRRLQPQRVVQEHLMNFRHVIRQVVFKLSLVFGFGPDHPQYIVMLGV